jgi:hypothetical protein
MWPVVLRDCPVALLKAQGGTAEVNVLTAAMPIIGIENER